MKSFHLFRYNKYFLFFFHFPIYHAWWKPSRVVYNISVSVQRSPYSFISDKTNGKGKKEREGEQKKGGERKV